MDSDVLPTRAFVFENSFGGKFAMRRTSFGGASKLIFSRAKELRSRQTFTEEILWNFLRTKPLGLKFRRQHPFSFYILDFYCHALKLVIEVDGSIHNLPDVKQNDEIRQRVLELNGLVFLRFTNYQIRSTPELVFLQIKLFCAELIEKNKDKKGKELQT